jgi:hypothetical protein
MDEIRWKICWTGIRGGAVLVHISKNRVAFIKRFVLKDNYSFETAQRILKDKVARILHLKNNVYPDLARLASYCIEATSVEESQDMNDW